MPKMTERLPFRITSTYWKIGGALACLLLILLWFGRSADVSADLTFAVRRGPLQISVLEGGSIEARQAQEIRSEIKGSTKILSIVEEGYLVTEEDVRNKKVLVELDSSELKDRITSQEIQLQSTQATLTEAINAYDIQFNQSRSDVQAAEQKARFALMDIEKYLGVDVTKEILTELGLPSDKHSIEMGATKAVTQAHEPRRTPVVQLAALASAGSTSDSGLSPGVTFTPRLQSPQETNQTSKDVLPPITLPSFALPTRSIASIDFTQYAKTNLLQGEAEQRLRKLDDDLLVAQSEAKLAETRWEGTKRLQEKDFVSKTELENDELTFRKADLKVRTGLTALALFKQYEFPRSAEEFVSKYYEALNGLDRANKEAISKRAQAEARLRSAQGRFRIEDEQTKELHQQMGKCVIHSEKPGLVVYGSGGDRRFYGEDQIREGATIRERQPIITIPDMTQMAVRVKIHEAQIKKVKRGMKARIQIEAFPDETLHGEVAKVGVLPDSQDRWMNPDLKVYQTMINIEGTYEWVKPGMSTRVEILVDTLEDVVYVPIQAVTPIEGKHYCHLVNGGGIPERHEVVVGEFNDEFIEIKSGLTEGRQVLLRGPDAQPAAGTEPAPGTEPAVEKPEAPVPPQSAPARQNPAPSSPKSAT